MYIADGTNHRVRKVTASTGVISTIAGTGTSSYSGDNGAATSAALSYPHGVAFDSSGSQYDLVICITCLYHFTDGFPVSSRQRVHR